MHDLDVEDLARRYLAGEPISHIAEGSGVTNKVIRTRLEKAGVRLRTNSESQRLRFGTPAVDQSSVAADYLKGESEQAIARQCGVSRKVIRDILVAAGVPIRTMSLANACRMAKLSPADRLRLAESAHAAVRGIPHSEEYRRKIAATREKRQTQASVYEERLSALLKDRGLDPIPQKAVGRYNIDLALAESSVAVEVFGGHWHSSGRHAREYRKRTDYVLDRGWSLVVVWCNALYPIGGGAADYIVSVHEARRSGEAGRGQEHVIWGNGHGGPVREG